MGSGGRQTVTDLFFRYNFYRIRYIVYDTVISVELRFYFSRRVLFSSVLVVTLSVLKIVITAVIRRGSTF